MIEPFIFGLAILAASELGILLWMRIGLARPGSEDTLWDAVFKTNYPFLHILKTPIAFLSAVLFTKASIKPEGAVLSLLIIATMTYIILCIYFAICTRP
jgi:hypothetical protein